MRPEVGDLVMLLVDFGPLGPSVRSFGIIIDNVRSFFHVDVDGRRVWCLEQSMHIVIKRWDMLGICVVQ